MYGFLTGRDKDSVNKSSSNFFS